MIFFYLQRNETITYMDSGYTQFYQHILCMTHSLNHTVGFVAINLYKKINNTFYTPV